MDLPSFTILLQVMVVLAIVVFIALFFVKAGYGMFRTSNWGFSVPNKLGWVLMEAPVFFVMLYFFLTSKEGVGTPVLVFFLLFELHYFQRSFVFPLLMNGKSRMPVVIMLMGVLFNVINGLLLGEWFFRLAPADMYEHWFTKGNFWIGLILFVVGMVINWHSDHVIRHLRAPGDTRHYLPTKGMYRYVVSGNYFGELVEWTGFAVMTASPAAWVFVLWTFANLAPRAHAIRLKYIAEFGTDAVGKRKRIIPFVF